MQYMKLNRVQQYLDWIKTKIYLDYNSEKAAKRIVKRGFVYECYFGRNVGSEQEKFRPCVVLQGIDGNRNSPNTIVAPITHTNSHLDIVVPISDKLDINGNKILDGHVLLGNIITVSKSRLGAEITQLTKDEMKIVDTALMKSIDLFWRYEKLQSIINDKDVYIKKLIKQRNELKLELDTIKNNNGSNL